MFPCIYQIESPDVHEEHSSVVPIVYWWEAELRRHRHGALSRDGGTYVMLHWSDIDIERHIQQSYIDIEMIDSA